MELVLVRHAQPQWYVDDAHQGFDPELSELGFQQAELLADELEGEHFDHIFVSPLLRARQTVAPLLKRLGREEVVAEWLREIKDPPWAGSPHSHILDLFDAEDRSPLDDRWNGLPGGERIDHFHDRINAGLDTFLADYGISRHDHEIPSWAALDSSPANVANGPKILCVAHGGTNAVVTAALLGANRAPFEWFRFWYAHATIGRFQARSTSGIIFFAQKGMENHHIPHDLRTA